MSETEHIKRTLRGMVQSAAGASVLLPGAVTAPDVTSALPWAGVGLVVSGLLAHAMDRPGTQFLLPNWLRISPSRRQPRAGPERDEQTVPARRAAPEQCSEHVHLNPQRSQPMERSAEQPTEQPEPSVRLVHIGPGPDGPTFAPNEPPPSDPAAELQRLRAAAEVGFARADGALALLEQRSHRTEEQLREHDQRLEALERNRWPLHVIEVLVAIGVMILTFWQLLADVSRPRPYLALLPGGGGGVRDWCRVGPGVPGGEVFWCVPSHGGLKALVVALLGLSANAARTRARAASGHTMAAAARGGHGRAEPGVPRGQRREVRPHLRTRVTPGVSTVF